MVEPIQYFWDPKKNCPSSRELSDTLQPMFDDPEDWIKILGPKSVRVGQGSRKATVTIQSNGSIVVAPGTFGVQAFLFVIVKIGYAAFVIPGLILAFLVQLPYIKRHSKTSALACLGLIVGLTATPNDAGEESSKLFNHVDPATWKQIEMEYKRKY